MGLYIQLIFIDNLSMNQQHLFEPIPCDKFDLLSREEIIELCKGYQDFNSQLLKRNKTLENKLLAGEQKSFTLNEQLYNIKNKFFGKSSEKSPDKRKGSKSKTQGKKRVRLPSERYKNLDIVEKVVDAEVVPNCPECSHEMQKSGLFESSEYLTFIPRKYYVVREKRSKYRCKCCQGGLVTTPAIPRIVPGGAYSDEMIIDVAMGKFLDLIPMERYTEMAAREGLRDLPANSLINTTHKLADFLIKVYGLIKNEVFEEEVIHADETPHRMLEGDKKSNWYMWGFSSNKASYFELRDTRSGEVASDLLKDSRCRYLVSDVFSGYSKAVREANEGREDEIEHLYCNSHSRRKFKEAEKNFEDEAKFFIRLYQRIYRLEDEELKTSLSPPERRAYQGLYMKVMERGALRLLNKHSKFSSIAKAIGYFLKNFEGLSRFTTQVGLPIDNNSQERELRSPVVGRKTWYGTHSKRGAKTTAIMFSIVQSCKLNKINPREYLTALIRDLHQGKSPYSPYQYSQI